MKLQFLAFAILYIPRTSTRMSLTGEKQKPGPPMACCDAAQRLATYWIPRSWRVSLFGHGLAWFLELGRRRSLAIFTFLRLQLCWYQSIGLPHKDTNRHLSQQPNYLPSPLGLKGLLSRWIGRLTASRRDSSSTTEARSNGHRGPLVAQQLGSLH